MKHIWPNVRHRLPPKGWLVIVPTLLIVATVLVLTETSSAAPIAAPQARVLLSQLLFQQQQPLCQSCHPDEYEAWKNTTHAKATLDPVFQEQLSKSHDKQACLQCHTTGFDTGSGKFLSEGVTCEACHGPYKEGHPAGQTMQLPLASGTCRMCHENAFGEWETSKHAEKNIQCFDCHLAHTQGLRTGSQETLCSACHSDQQTQVTHSTHGINGVDCSGCHMAEQMKPAATQAGLEIPVRTHTFTVPADVCNKCHKSTIHSGATTSLNRTVAVTAQSPPLEKPARETELEQQVTDMQTRLNSLRNIGVVSMGLALALGGFLGLLIGVGGMALWHRSRAQ